MARVDNHELLRDDAIDLLYDAAIEPATRRRGLSMLAQTLDAAGAFYLVWDKDNNVVVDAIVAGTLTPEFVAQYRARWGVLDPRRRFLERAHAESIFVSHYDRTEAILEDGGFERALPRRAGNRSQPRRQSHGDRSRISPDLRRTRCRAAARHSRRPR